MGGPTDFSSGVSASGGSQYAKPKMRISQSNTAQGNARKSNINKT